ncbi:MAG: 30S ribosomal protein S24e [Methanobacterium sp.]|uniref:30S ribosomal protein S24e n=1 Tax=Methanobacterium sp. TaxID=2164 RepID=UPI003D662734|nr:30S ribosomal protein S24e [Methanobacterium sp.]
MEIEIREKIENPLLNRTEIHFDCIYQGESTPKVLDIKNKLVALLDADKNLLVVDKVLPNFGEGKADGYAKIYDSEENLNEIETEHVLAKNKETQEEEETSEEE